MRILFLTNSHFDPDPDERAALLSEFTDIDLVSVPLADYPPELVERAEIIVGFPKPEDLVRATNLKWLQTPSSGVGQYMDRALFAHEGVILTNAKGTYGPQIADHVLGMIIGFNHNLFLYHDQMKEQKWYRYVPTKDLWQSTIIIIGLGDIGTNLATRAKAHGMRTIAVKRTMAEKPSSVDELYTIDKLDGVLGQGDYVVLCAASTDETEHLIDAKRLSLMKEGSYLINVGRGSLVDEEALIKALESGHLGGAGLDVTATEPLEKESPLWSLPNVLITPHASGLSYSDPHQVFTLFRENMRRLRDGVPLKNHVDFERGY